ncbi:rhodanese-like domain-containing protein [Sulfoacidibacillus ferrooxidans]|uniref:Adenylyltransferase/sulfurtransferase MoeZ n=1 Tax=Sulfoacidibacillus ferrooxidans TaxID=2005001 RepID=A0A9X1VBM2_9BACL|nr:rhodanese-like domain-containing protein [Sulfoacidibacillus ferrooxidans]MCI0184310.1 putative adenylyltransferase/sulfurtransferase MoeZ [Sulfoacidibacillus ferrooxidans]
MNLLNLFRHPNQLIDLTPQEVQNKSVHGASYIIDVRSKGEYQSGHIDGAQHYPLGQEHEILNHFSKEDHIILICKTGHRSQAAANELFKLGFIHVSHLKGGMDKWKREEKPVRKE